MNRSRPTPDLRALSAALLLASSGAACSPPGSDSTADDADPTARAETPADGASAPECDPDDGGIQLPPGFCATVYADSLGWARHLAVRDNGDVYVALKGTLPESQLAAWRKTPAAPGGIVALRDEDGDGTADRRERLRDKRFQRDGGTEIEIRGDTLYFGADTAIYRHVLQPTELAPQSRLVPLVAGFPVQVFHASKAFAIGGAGSIYVTVGAPSNACQAEDRARGSPGQTPCPELSLQSGVWRYSASDTAQRHTAEARFASGLRNAMAIAWNDATETLWVVQHGRDQLDALWPALFTAEDNAELPAEELLRLTEGDVFGWPYCYYDGRASTRVRAPEYGGDGVMVDGCEAYPDPVLAFPAHFSPNDLVFYDGGMFPSRYEGGAFIAFHGSWNRSPVQAGYRVAFVPFRDGAPEGEWETFADGFAGPEPIASRSDARFRPTGLAVGPDGALYVADSMQGRVWRIIYRGEGE